MLAAHAIFIILPYEGDEYIQPLWEYYRKGNIPPGISQYTLYMYLCCIDAVEGEKGKPKFHCDRQPDATKHSICSQLN